MNPKCAVSGCTKEATRIVVRDEYEGIRRSYKLPLSVDDEDRMYGALDQIPDSWKHAQCELSHREDEE